MKINIYTTSIPDLYPIPIIIHTIYTINYQNTFPLYQIPFMPLPYYVHCTYTL